MDWMHLLWLVVALAIAGVVMVTGVLDLIWLAVAAFVAFLVGWVAGIGSPWVLLIVFAVCAGGLILVGRFVRLPQPPETGLNRRSVRLVGEAGTALDDFSGGRGKISIEDMPWAARAADPTRPVVRGDTVRVIAAEGVTLIVEPERSDRATERQSTEDAHL